MCIICIIIFVFDVFVDKLLSLSLSLILLFDLFNIIFELSLKLLKFILVKCLCIFGNFDIIVPEDESSSFVLIS